MLQKRDRDERGERGDRPPRGGRFGDRGFGDRGPPRDRPRREETETVGAEGGE
jgi:small subunit ribosomal protein S6